MYVQVVMSGKVGTCLAIKSSQTHCIVMSWLMYSSRTLITEMFDLALDF